MARIGIVTTAHIHTPGFVKRLQARSDIQVAGVWDPDAALAAKWAGELKTQVVDCWTAFTKDAAIDGIVVTGTTAQHDKIVVDIAKARKNVFVEKPLATTGAEASRIFTAIKESGVIFQTGHFMRGDAINRFIKQELDAGNLGTVTRARHSNCHSGALSGWFDKEYRWFFQRDQAGGGGFYDLGCHSVDILNYFFGAVESATAALAPKTVKYTHIDEYGEGILKFKNGVIATVTGSWVDVANPVSCLISGTEGHLLVANGKVYYSSKKTAVPGADGKEPIDAAHFPPGLPHAFELFLDVLVGKADKNVLIPVEDALNVARAMEAMYLGDKLGQWVKV